MDYHSKEEMVQFLFCMGNKTLSIQMSAQGHREVKAVL